MKLSHLLLFAGTFFLIAGCGQSGDYEEASSVQQTVSGLKQLHIQSGDSLLFSSAPPDSHSVTFSVSGTAADLSDSLIIASSLISMQRSPSSISSAQQNEMLHLSLDETLTISVRINRSQSIGNDIRSLTGSIQKPYDGSVTLTVQGNRVSGTIDVLSEGRLFYIRFDPTVNSHFLAEIDRSELDIQEGSDPLSIE